MFKHETVQMMILRNVCTLFINSFGLHNNPVKVILCLVDPMFYYNLKMFAVPNCVPGVEHTAMNTIDQVVTFIGLGYIAVIPILLLTQANTFPLRRRFILFLLSYEL